MWSFVSLPYRAIKEITRLEIDLASMTHGRRATTGATTVYLFSLLWIVSISIEVLHPSITPVFLLQRHEWTAEIKDRKCRARVN